MIKKIGLKVIVLAYIVAVIVFSARANALTSDSNPVLFFKDHQAEPIDSIHVQDPLPNKMNQFVPLVKVAST